MKSFGAQRIDRYAVCQRIAGRFDSILALHSGETRAGVESSQAAIEQFER